MACGLQIRVLAILMITPGFNISTEFSRNTCLGNYRGVFSRYEQSFKDNSLEPGRHPSFNRMKLNTEQMSLNNLILFRS